MTKDEIAETIERVALQDLMDEAGERTRKDICQDCMDRRCKQGRICKEFIRRAKSYAWEIVAEKAEMN